MVVRPLETSEDRRQRRRIVAGLIVALWIVCSWLASPPAYAAESPETVKRVGYSIRIPLPIDGQAANRVRQFVRRAIEKRKPQALGQC